MKSFFLFLTALGCFQIANAQTAEDSVKATVNKLFEGMKASDAQMIQEVFGDSAVLQTITRNKEGKTVVLNEEVKAFAASVAKLAKGDADERIQFDVVKTDGPLAIVWTPYRFFYKGNFSHCGVNSFQLVRFNGVWKIQYLIDTRRKSGCQE
ncbi:MAG: nuclear transport factor 2 family protein [Ferruginibacter sp.]